MPLVPAQSRGRPSSPSLCRPLCRTNRPAAGLRRRAPRTDIPWGRAAGRLATQLLRAALGFGNVAEVTAGPVAPGGSLQHESASGTGTGFGRAEARDVRAWRTSGSISVATCASAIFLTGRFTDARGADDLVGNGVFKFLGPQFGSLLPFSLTSSAVTPRTASAKLKAAAARQLTAGFEEAER